MKAQFSLVVLLIISLATFGQPKSLPNNSVSAIFGGNYLGLETPGDKPVLFAPGIISKDKDPGTFEISSNGKEMLYTNDGSVIRYAKGIDNFSNHGHHRI